MKLPLLIQFAGCAVLAGLLACSSGCQRKAVVKKTRVAVATTIKSSSAFDVAMDFLNNLDQYQPEQVHSQILANLQKWSRKEPALDNWIADPMFSRLPADARQMFSTEGLGTQVFEPYDTSELQEAVWMRDVARSVARQPLQETRLQQWLEQAIEDGRLSQSESSDLSLAYRLFDWTVRNIQLDPEVEDFDILGGERERERRDRDTLRHHYYAWENLLYGHGDWLERSRVFILLGRQLGINIVMLMAERDQEPDQPWVTAVLLGDQLYLFDSLLGIPLPGQGGAPFASLDDYVNHPELLDALTVESDRYRIVKSDLTRLKAVVDATPAALSQRFKQIETQLTGDRKVVLTIAPTPLARKLRECKHITDVEIWPLPYRSFQFFQSLGKNPEAALPLLAKRQQEQQPFRTRGPLMRGRLLHLRGKYTGEYDDPGATKLYLQSRMSQKELERFNIPMDEVPKESPLVAKLPQDPVEARLLFDRRLQEGRAMAVRAKDRATYWLGLASFDSQNSNKFRVAADFFKLNVADENSAWKQSAQYNLARAYEAMGLQANDPELIGKAIELLESDQTTPQRAGNRIRARRLREMIE